MKSRQETVEVVRVVLRERVQQHGVELTADKSIPQVREEKKMKYSLSSQFLKECVNKERSAK